MKRRRWAGFGWMPDTLVFVLLGIFALLSTMLIVVGAQAYQRVISGASEHAQEQILVGYVIGKVRADDRPENLRIEERDGVNALVISQQLDGEGYETWIYCYEGWLTEQLKAAEEAFDPEYGEALCEATEFAPQLANDGQYLFEITATDGKTYQAYYKSRLS